MRQRAARSRATPVESGTPRTALEKVSLGRRRQSRVAVLCCPPVALGGGSMALRRLGVAGTVEELRHPKLEQHRLFMPSRDAFVDAGSACTHGGSSGRVGFELRHARFRSEYV